MSRPATTSEKAGYGVHYIKIKSIEGLIGSILASAKQLPIECLSFHQNAIKKFLGTSEFAADVSFSETVRQMMFDAVKLSESELDRRTAFLRLLSDCLTAKRRKIEAEKEDMEAEKRKVEAKKALVESASQSHSLVTVGPTNPSSLIGSPSTASTSLAPLPIFTKFTVSTILGEESEEDQTKPMPPHETCRK